MATTISWTAPTTRTDGSTLDSAITYDVYDSINGSQPGLIASAIAATTMNTVFPVGTHVITVVARDVSGKSIPSSEITFAIYPPSAPGNVSVSLSDGGSLGILATISWTSPTTRTDGSALLAADISHFVVFDSINGATPVQIASLSDTSTPGKALVAGTHVITVQAIDQSNAISALASAAPVTVAPPSAPTSVIASTT